MLDTLESICNVCHHLSKVANHAKNPKIDN